MKAALLNLEQTLQNSISTRQTFSLLLIDGKSVFETSVFNGCLKVDDFFVRIVYVVFSFAGCFGNPVPGRWYRGPAVILDLSNVGGCQRYHHL